MILDNCMYDKIKLLHKLSCILWFIKKHALEDARADSECTQVLKELEADLEKHTAALKRLVCE